MLIDGITCDVLPATDRGLAYGDGLFETIRLSHGKALFLDEHLERLSIGCTTLQLHPDFGQIKFWLQQTLASAPPNAILKLIVTRGSGGRGYRIPAEVAPRCLISVHPLPENLEEPAKGIRAFVCKQRLAWQPTLAGLKHLNRLEQVLASTEFPDLSYSEGLMLDYSDKVIEGTRTNLFIGVKGKLLTPDLQGSGINGVMRRKLLEHFSHQAAITTIPLEQLLQADEIFLVNSVVGIWPVTHLTCGNEEHDFTPGSFSRSAALYFQKALGI